MRIKLKDIAENTGVSVNTVSLALRNMPGVKPETKQHILRFAEDMGYFTQKEEFDRKNICLIISSENLKDSYFYTGFQQVIIKNTLEYNYNTIVYNSDSCNMPLNELKQIFAINSVNGIIILGDMNESIVEHISKCDLPIIVIGARYHHLKIPTIIEDNIQGAFMAVEYLVNHGHHSISYIGWPNESAGHSERFMGYIGAMEYFGLSRGDSQCITSITHEDIYDYFTVAKHLKNMDHLPQAFLCGNDFIAMAVIKALQYIGLSVPDDISLIGFDNSEHGKMANPTLTSVDVMKSIQAKAAVRLLMLSIKNNTDVHSDRILMPMELVEGDSVKKSRIL